MTSACSIDIRVTDGDAAEYVRRVSDILDGILATTRPANVIAVKIDHAFDHKWLGYCGKIWEYVSRWQTDDLVIPPFIPDRVMSQRSFTWDEQKGGYVRCSDSGSLHRLQHSSDNVRRKISRLWGSVLLFWYTGDTADTGRGSMMIYHHGPAGDWSGYMSLSANNHWRHGRFKGISQREIEFFERRWQETSGTT